MRPRRPQGGFTLVELMVVVAVIIALSAVAMMTLRSSSQGGAGPIGLTRQIVSELEDMRMRGISNRRWQRLVIEADHVVHEESESVGMAVPTTWNTVRTLTANQVTRICGVEAAARVQPAGACGGEVPAIVIIAPDGSIRSDTGQYGEPATIYVESLEGESQYRVVVYRATGLAVMFEGH
jgi:prepilin-type N-terminal cleavage/methylation domain-containing protein